MKSNISSETLSDFVVTYLTPATPSEDSTIIQVKLNYRVNNAFYYSTSYAENFVVMTQIFDYDTPSYNISTTWHFDGFESSVKWITDPSHTTSSSLSFFLAYQGAYRSFYPRALLDVKSLPNGNLSACYIAKPTDSDSQYLFLLFLLSPAFLLVVIGVILYNPAKCGCSGGGGDGGGGDSGGYYTSFNDNNNDTGGSSGGWDGGGGGGSSHGTSGFAD